VLKDLDFDRFENLKKLLLIGDVELLPNELVNTQGKSWNI